jgi:hypothetical protein
MTKLTIVDPSQSSSIASPSSLGEAGRKLWHAIQREYAIDDAAGRVVLEQICLCADLAERCSRRIEADGPLIRSKQGMRAHPLLKIEQSARTFVVRTLRQLGLDIEPTRDVVGRPSGTHNPTR